MYSFSHQFIGCPLQHLLKHFFCQNKELNFLPEMDFSTVHFKFCCLLSEMILPSPVPNTAWWIPKLSNPEFYPHTHTHWSLDSGPSLRVDRSCRGPHLPSPQTTCLSIGLLACNLRQSSRSEEVRMWLYVFWVWLSSLAGFRTLSGSSPPRAATLWGAQPHDMMRVQQRSGLR